MPMKEIQYLVVIVSLVVQGENAVPLLKVEPFWFIPPSDQAQSTFDNYG